MFPVAWAVVEGDNSDSWGWFLKNLQRDLGSNVTGRGWTIISDQQEGLIHAVKEILPEAEHRCCVRHIYANFRKQYGGVGMRALFWQACKCSTKEEFVKIIKEIKSTSQEAYDWLMRNDFHYWVRAFFSFHYSNAAVENNMCETFNGWINESKRKPICTMLEEIRFAVMVRMDEGVVAMDKVKERYTICLAIRKKLEKYKQAYRFWRCKHNSAMQFECKNGEVGFTVDMNKLTYSCRMWQLEGIPCTHAICVIYSINDDPNKYVANWYKLDKFFQSYEFPLKPQNGENMWPLVKNKGDLLPPSIKRPAGRPKRNRRKKANKEPKTRKNPHKISRVGRKMKCAKCKQYGHNRSTCTNEPVGPQIFRVRKKKNDGKASQGRARNEEELANNTAPRSSHTVPKSSNTVPTNTIEGSSRSGPRNSKKRKSNEEVPPGFGLFISPTTGVSYFNSMNQSAPRPLNDPPVRGSQSCISIGNNNTQASTTTNR